MKSTASSLTLCWSASFLDVNLYLKWIEYLQNFVNSVINHHTFDVNYFKASRYCAQLLHCIVTFLRSITIITDIIKFRPKKSL